MEGPDENNGHLELSVFVEKVRHFLDMLNRSVKESVDEAIVFHVVHLSSTIDGRLEQINIHNNVNTFRIYASSPASYSVNCGFPPNLLETVQSSPGAFVSVSGECLCRPAAPFI